MPPPPPDLMVRVVLVEVTNEDILAEEKRQKWHASTQQTYRQWPRRSRSRESCRTERSSTDDCAALSVGLVPFITRFSREIGMSALRLLRSVCCCLFCLHSQRNPSYAATTEPSQNAQRATFSRRSRRTEVLETVLWSTSAFQRALNVCIP